MYCKKCGKEICEQAKYCPYCGAQLYTAFDVSKEENGYSTEVSFVEKLKTKKRYVLILGIVIAILIIIFSIISCVPKSPESILLSKTWYLEPNYAPMYNGYHADGEALTFFSDGKSETQCYSLGSTAEAQSKGWVKEHVYPHEWQISNDDSLYYNGQHYKFSKEESGKTWYVSNDTLRIGKKKYNTNDIYKK